MTNKSDENFFTANKLGGYFNRSASHSAKHYQKLLNVPETEELTSIQ